MRGGRGLRTAMIVTVAGLLVTGAAAYLLRDVLWAEYHILVLRWGGRESRKSAAFLLGEMQWARASPCLLEKLRKSSPLNDGSSRVYLEALQRIGKGAASHLAKALSVNEPMFHLSVLRLFSELGPEARIAIPQLIEVLKTEKGRYRNFAHLALAGIGPPAVPTLEAVLLDSSCEPEARCLAHFALETIASREKESRAVEALGRAFLAADQMGRDLAVDALLRLGEPGLQALIPGMEHPDLGVRRSALRGLAGLRVPLDPAVPVLVKLLNDTDPLTRGRAAGLVPRSRPEAARAAVEPLLECLKDREVTVRAGAANSLGQIGSQLGRSGSPDARIPPALEATLGDPSEYVREATCWSLGELGPAAASAVPRLREILQSEKPAFVLQAAVALAKIRQGEAADMVPILMEQYRMIWEDPRNEDTKELRCLKIVQALGRIGSPEAIRELRRMSEGPHEKIREAALHTLPK